MIDEHVTVQARPLSEDQRKWLERAWTQIDPRALGEFDAALVSIPSPTGEERRLAEFITSHLHAAGFEAHYQPIDADQGNAVGRLRGSGEGADLLLYAPIDTAFTGDEAEDVPWLGPSVRTDLRSSSRSWRVTTSSARAPKTRRHTPPASIAAAEAVRRADIPLKRHAAGRTRRRRHAHQPPAWSHPFEHRPGQRLLVHARAGRPRRLRHHRQARATRSPGKKSACAGSKSRSRAR